MHNALHEMPLEEKDHEFSKEEQENSSTESEYEGDAKLGTSPAVSKNSYLQILYGFQNRGSYRHASKNCEIVGVTHNSRFRQFIILDSRGITTWSYESVYSTVTRHLNYPSYQFNLLRLLVFSRKFNVYFALSREYALKVFNLNFHEVFSVSADMHSVLCMVFNPVRDELITGGTGGMKFWVFGELENAKQKAWERGSRPMANYGLALRASYPKMGGSWVKHVELDQAMQRLYCLSERDVVAYDMEGNFLFQINDAHRGPVTGCVYSKACNFLVTVGSDCDVNVWSGSGGRVHTFTGHTKAITKILLYPETSAVVLTASLDGLVKVYALEMMEEIYSLPVFSDGIQWMDVVANKTLYCSSSRVIEVFFLNYIFDFWSQTRCSVTSLSLVTSHGKSSRVMAVGNDSSVRLISRGSVLLSTVLPPPSISPLHQVLDVAYNREYNMMFLLINEQEIWVYYTRTNPATRMDVWEITTVQDIHSYHSRDTMKSRTASPTPDSFRSPSPRMAASPPLSSRAASPSLLPTDPLHTKFDRVQITCLGVLYSHVLMDSAEGDMCPDVTSFLLAGTQDGRVLFLHMFWKGLKYHELQAHKDKVLSVHHDQVTNTLVIKCRAHGGLLAIQIWSLPFLHLQKQISCPGDLTCFTRMNDRLLCGYESGHLRLYALSGDDSEIFKEQVVTSTDNKRTIPRDHQDVINSVDANLELEIFCTSSQDGYIKIWDKDKAPLCEIMADETLTVASFLNKEGDILVGFKQQIFKISHKKISAVYSFKERNVEQERTADLRDDEAFETESDVYEDPSVRWDSKKILQPDPTNMENYLVPFPNLLQKTSWFLEGRPPPVLDYQDGEEDGQESLLALSDSVSLAPTDVYYSAQSTPRSMSLASLPVRRDSTALWELPEFGNSPVSSPPRTPPPQRTPPPSPPPEIEIVEDEKKASPEVTKQEIEIPCVQCKESTKKSRKKGPSIPSFKREGGRFGNVKIDSRSLRSRKGLHKLDPKDEKQQRLQKPVSAKKMKKLLAEEARQAAKELAKEAEKEAVANAQKEEEIKPPAEGDKETQQEKDSADKNEVSPPEASGQTEGDEARLVEDKVALDNQQAFQLRGAVDNAIPPPLAPLPPRDRFMFPNHPPPPPTAKPEEIQGNLGNDGKPQDPNAPQLSQNLEENKENQVNQENNAPATETETGENQEQDGAENRMKDDVNENLPRDSSPVPALVTYVDPDTGDIVERPEGEVPDGVEILDVFHEGEGEEGEEGEDFQESGGEGDIVEEFPSESKTKSVKFKMESKGRKKRDSIAKQSPASTELTLNAQESHAVRARWISSPKSTVVPVYETYVPRGLEQRKSNSELNVSPLTIFALAKNRRQNEASRDTLDYRYSSRRGQPAARKLQSRELYIPREKWEVESLGSSDDDYIQLMEEVGLVESESGRSTADLRRPPSVKKTGGDMMKWCVQALKKTKSPIFPQKPSRPGSSPSSTSSRTKPQGDTLFLNIPSGKSRPKTAGSVKSQEKFTMFPYKNSREAGNEKRRSRDRKPAPGIKAKTHAQKSGSSEEDDDILDVYKELQTGLKDSTPIPLYVPSHSDDDRLDPSSDLPVLDISDYSGNWQNKVLERARRLKQQRLERQKSATVRRQMLESQQKQRRKKAGHVECSQDLSSKPEKIIEFLRSPSAPLLSENASPVPQDSALRDQNPNCKDLELSYERPYRIRIHPQPGLSGLTRTAKSLMNVTSSEHDLADIVEVLPKPPSTASIPSKCSRFVLITQGSESKQMSEPTPLEKTLLLLRFPKSRIQRRRHTTVPRPHTGQRVRMETEQEY